MKRTITLLAALFTAAAAIAANPSIEITGRNTAGNELELTASVVGHGTFTVVIDFTRTINTDTPERIIKEITGNGPLMVLEALDASLPVEAEFTYNWLHGRIDPPADREYAYRVPFGTGTIATARSAANSDPRARRTNYYLDFKMWEFVLDKNDTVFAARGGLVIRIDGQDSEGRAEEGRVTDVYIEHDDGTIARYSHLDGRSLRRKEGDMVQAGDELAKVGKQGEDDYAMTFSVYYFTTNRNNRVPDMLAQALYFDPLFATTAGNRRLKDGERLTAPEYKTVYKKNKELTSDNCYRLSFRRKKANF